jgi:transposase InsO family protein
MKKKEEHWAIFWCDLLAPIIFSDIEPEQTHQFLKQLASKEVVFPDGQLKKPSLSTLKRKLKKFQTGGFNALFRKTRLDIDKPRVTSEEVIAKAIELKKEQPRRSPKTINRFLNDLYGVTIRRSTLYFHLKKAGATRLKLVISTKKVRGRWSRDHSNSLWVGDFEEGPYVLANNNVMPTYLSAFIDCHSRYLVEARYYYAQSLDVLIDSLIRALTKFGAPFEIYVDNAKVYHSHGLKMACYKMHTRLIFRPVREPESGGLVERFFQTVQDQFEAEVRAGEILTLDQLNKAFSAYMAVDYHKDYHSEIKCSPEECYQKGLRAKRQVDIEQILEAFMQRVTRTVNRTFSDIQLNKRFYRVDVSLRGDRVQVAFDPFSRVDTVKIYSLNHRYLGTGKEHFRKPEKSSPISATQPKPKHNYLDLLVRQHQCQLESQTKTIDYRKATQSTRWPFHEFAKTVAHLLGNKGGLSSFSSDQLERLKKLYNQSAQIERKMVEQAFENACNKSLPYIVYELKQLIK